MDDDEKTLRHDGDDNNDDDERLWVPILLPRATPEAILRRADSIRNDIVMLDF